MGFKVISPGRVANKKPGAGPGIANAEHYT
jgi:hypothetical protein